MSFAADLYLDLYGRLCGRPPRVYPWHFQWLATRSLLLPGWLLMSLATNTMAILLDWLDHTKAFYGNTFVIARKKWSDQVTSQTGLRSI